MKCKFCNIEMVMGKAVKPNTEENARYIISQPLINKDTIELIDVWKCLKCGQSDYIKD